MKTRLLFTLTLVLVQFGVSFAQAPSPSHGVQPADETDVVRITTNLIQVDAIVTDKKGNKVANLRPEDFEVFVNGKPQPITNFSAMTGRVNPQPAADLTVLNKPAGPVPPVSLRRDEVNRSIALVVDDLTLSFKSLVEVRRALKKFVDEQIGPGDLVAILQTGSGIGTLQQFTSNKQQLYAAIERLKYNWAVGRLDTFTEIGGGPVPTGKKKSNPDDGSIKIPGDDSNNEYLEQGALASTKYIVEAMRTLPGRKSVMLLSEGFSMVSEDDSDVATRTREKVRKLIDGANRAGVAIYALDARGLVDEGLVPGVMDLGMRPTSQQLMRAMRNNRERFQRPLDGMMYLTEQTGGFTVRNTNDLAGGIRKALDDQISYYLLGFRPDSEIFNSRRDRFNELTIKVKRPGLKVRYRTGFFAIDDDDIKHTERNSEEQTALAVISPFTSAEIALRLTPLFTNDAKSQSFLRTLVHIDAKNLSFVDNPDGSKQTVIHIAAFTFGDNGTIATSRGETHTLTLPPALYERMLTTGLVYSLDVPIRHPGPYQLRVAVSDNKSKRIGTANQFVNVPDLSKGRLTLSGIALNSYFPKTSNSSNAEAAAITSSPLTQAAQRRFRAGQVLQFAYAIYNAKVSLNTKQPQLTTQIKLYRDGQEVYVGQPEPSLANSQSDFQHLVVEEGIRLSGLKEGEYVLQITATDLLAKGKYRTTTGWIDFELTK